MGVVSLNSATISQRNKIVFEDLDFKINSGEFVFLIGKTGSGKSSLIKTLYGDIHVCARLIAILASSNCPS